MSKITVINLNLFSDPCPVGTHKSTGMTTCEPCATNTVASNTGAVMCAACSHGSVSNSDKTDCGEYYNACSFVSLGIIIEAREFAMYLGI